MSDLGREHYDDEIDLFEIVEILWQGKWIIVASVFIALAAAYAYLMNKEVVYEYNLPYSSITAPDAGAFNHFLTLSDVPFSLNTKSKTLSLTSVNPNYEAVISSEAAIIGNKLTQSLVDEANLTLKLMEEESQSLVDEANLTLKLMENTSQYLIDEANLTLKLIKEDIPVQILNSEVAAKRYFEAKSVLQNITDGAEDVPVQILNSEVAAKRYFEAKSVLQKITDGASAIEFQSVVKTVKSPKVPLVLALSVVMGGMMGLFFIFLLRMVAAYKKRQQVAI